MGYEDDNGMQGQQYMMAQQTQAGMMKQMTFDRNLGMAFEGLVILGFVISILVQMRILRALKK